MEMGIAGQQVLLNEPVRPRFLPIPEQRRGSPQLTERLEARMVKLVASDLRAGWSQQRGFVGLPGNVPKRRQSLLHDGPRREQVEQGIAPPLQVH